MYDIIIVGSGPAGLTAALYARRADKSVLVLEQSTLGGQVTFSPRIENYPGFVSMSGNEFIDKLVDQVIEQGADIDLKKVIGIRDNGETKTVITEKGELEAKAVIIATGVKHRQTGLERENELVGHGISYCAVCDGAFYKGRKVAVLGGGNSALQEAVLLSDLAQEVYVLQDLDFLTGEAKLVESISEKANVKVVTGCRLTGLIGENALEGIEIERVSSGEKQNIAVDGLFVAIGLIPDNDSFKAVAALDEFGYFDSDESCLTDTPGVFVAGDCRSKKIRQITTASADGAVAALAACRYTD